TVSSRAATSLLRWPLAVERETLAQYASSVAVSVWPPIRAFSIVARAVSPTRAATSTRFAAATILNPIADAGSISIENSLAWTEPFARDNCQPHSKNALTGGTHHGNGGGNPQEGRTRQLRVGGEQSRISRVWPSTSSQHGCRREFR